MKKIAIAQKDNLILGQRMLRGVDVRFWPVADIASCTAHVCF